MRIGSINNTTFEARIKLAKPDTTKLVKGTATALAGTASLAVGFDSFNIGSNPGITEKICESAYNERMIDTPHGRELIGNNDSALLVGSFLGSSLPLGSTTLLTGLKKLQSQDNPSKKIPK